VPGRKIERVSWDEKTVYVNLLRETIKQSPEYTEESLLTRDTGPMNRMPRSIPVEANTIVDDNFKRFPSRLWV